MKRPIDLQTRELKLPHGFRYAGVACGIKASGDPDLALITSDIPVAAAGVYTQNRVRASSIDWNEALTPSRDVCGVVVNSGNANACTGATGRSDTERMAEIAARRLNCPAESVLVLSTGVIGQALPMDCVQRGIEAACEQAASGRDRFIQSADAIRTTDAFGKWACRTIPLASGSAVLAGMCKGAGMIGPQLATMLAVLVTDAALAPEALDRALRVAVDESFNRISVEGHTSTNDAVLLLSHPRGTPCVEADDEAVFQRALTELCIELAKMIPADGEGARHLIEIRVAGTADDRQAESIARTVGASPLVKTAVTGGDPNWGRIVSAAGYAGVPFEVRDLTLILNGHTVFEGGQPARFDPPRVSQEMQEAEEVLIELTVGSGPGRARHWTSDLTVDYVRFNSEYTT